MQEYIKTFKKIINTLEAVDASKDALTQLREVYNDTKVSIEENSKVYLNYFDNSFEFIEKYISDKNIMSIWITTITSSSKIIQYLAQNRCEYYHKHSKDLLIANNEQVLLQSIEEFESV